MKLKAIICDVLQDSFDYWKSFSNHIIDIETVESLNHEHPEKINAILFEKIIQLDSMPQLYDYILLGYGLCGKALEGLQAGRIPMVVPRAHDCITLFMGSKERYNDYFLNNPGTMFYIAAWIERNGIENVRKELNALGLFVDESMYKGRYAKEETEYLISISKSWKEHYTKALYIASSGSKDYSSEIKNRAEQNGWAYESFAENTLLIKDMVCACWEPEKFLIIPPFSKIRIKPDESIVGVEFQI